VAVDPETVNCYFMDGTLFNVELAGTHPKRAAWDPNHARVPRIRGTT
jgi:hypothetical protein